jgi:filamentous hemagglutinin
VQIPSGFVAEDLSGNRLIDADGNPITSFQLNAGGQAVIEIKTGNATLSSDQTIVYPQLGTGGTVSGVGGNAAAAGVNVQLPPIPVIVLRKP